MKPVMYVVANAGANMSHGKLAAQVAHAAVEAYRLSLTTTLVGGWEPAHTEYAHTPIVDAWYQGGHYTKIVLMASNTEDLLVKERYIEERGFRTALIIDEGRTEIDPFTPTAVGVEVVDKDVEHVRDTFSTFKTYRHPEPPKKRGLLAR